MNQYQAQIEAALDGLILDDATKAEVVALVRDLRTAAKSEWYREIGKAGGRARSERKAQACRENGRKGGRPRKEIACGY